MIRKWIIPIALVFTAFCWYIYTCHLRCSCNATAPPITTIKTILHQPVEFASNSNEAVKFDGWNSYRDSLIQLAKSGKIIQITGYYGKDEKNTTSFENLGIARANAIKNLLIPNIPESQILLRSIQHEGAFESGSNTAVFSNVAVIDPVVAPKGDEGGVVQRDDKTTLIYFPSGSSKKDVNKDVDTYLLNLATKLKANNGTALITGHTDSKGKFDDNLKLSENRAAQIKAILVKNGVNEKNLNTTGKADKEPVGDNNTNDGRKANRRVEIILQ